MTTWVAIITDSDTTDPVVLTAIGATHAEALAAAREAFVDGVMDGEDDGEWDAMLEGDSEWRITVITAANAG